MLFFTEQGKCFWLRVYAVPEGSKVAKGRPVQNLMNIENGDSIRAVINVKSITDPDYINNNFIVGADYVALWGSNAQVWLKGKRRILKK